MNKTMTAALCVALFAAGSAHAAGPLAKVRGAMPALHPVGVRVAGIDLAGAQGKGLLAGLGVASGSGVGHGIVGASVLSGPSSGAGLVGIGALSGVGSGKGAVSIGVANAGQTPLHVGVLGRNLIGH